MKTMLKKIGALSMALIVAASASMNAQAAAGYKFSYKGVKVQMDSPAKKLIKKCGKPQKKKEKKSCAYKGKDRTYQYKDFILVTYSKSAKGAEYVQSIQFRTNKVKTAEGIKIGSSENDVKKKYKKATNMFGIYTTIKGNTKLQMEVANGKVKNIRYICKSVK